MLIRQRTIIFLFLLLSFGCTTNKTSEATSGHASPTIGGNIEEGKKLYKSCIACHGTSGEGDEDLKSPSLANSDTWYLYRQLMNFKNGIRGSSPNDTSGYQMAAMSNTLKDSIDVSHVVAYINTLPAVSLPAVLKGDIQKGKRIYENLCGSCHGQAASGNEKMNAPNLNGLEDWYIKRQVYNFKNGLRGTHPKDILGGQMVPMMALLTNNQAVDDVIAYIRSTAQVPTK